MTPIEVLANILGTPSLLFRIIELVLAGAPTFSFLAFFPFMHFTTLFSGVRSVERRVGIFSYFLHLCFNETFKVNNKDKLKKRGKDCFHYREGFAV